MGAINDGARDAWSDDASIAGQMRRWHRSVDRHRRSYGHNRLGVFGAPSGTGSPDLARLPSTTGVAGMDYRITDTAADHRATRNFTAKNCCGCPERKVGAGRRRQMRRQSPIACARQTVLSRSVRSITRKLTDATALPCGGR